MSKQSRTQLSLKEKLSILNKLDQKISRKLICDEFNCAPSTLTAIAKNRQKIEDSAKDISKKTKRLRGNAFPGLDSALLQWFTQKRSQNVAINGPILLEKANEFARGLAIETKTGEVTMSWISRFKERHDIEFRQISGESGAVNMNIMEDWIKSEWPVISNGYKPEDIFNADEFGLFFKMLPDRSLSFKGEKCSGGKMSKERISVLCCANANGSEKVKLLVIGKSAKPRCFSRTNMENLPVVYKANKKSWMTGDLFSEWLINWDKKLRRQRRHILLVVDNCTAHPKTIKLNNIKLAFFPANVSSVLQPMDQGVIKNVKHFYRGKILRRQIESIDKKEQFKIDMKDVVVFLSDSWDQVKGATIKNCFMHSKLISDHREVEMESEDDVEMETGDPEEQPFVPNGVDFEEYVNFDMDVRAVDCPTDQEIIQSVLNVPDDDDETEDEEDSAQTELPRMPTNYEAQGAIEALRTYMLTKIEDESEAVQANVALRTLDKIVSSNILRNLRQSLISTFINK